MTRRTKLCSLHSMKSNHNNGTWWGSDHLTKQQVTTVTSAQECVDKQWTVTKICPLCVWSGVSKYYFCWVSKYYFRGVSKYYIRGVSKYYFRGVSKYYSCGVSKYCFEYKYTRQSGVECIVVARKARPPYGVSTKKDCSNMRELIRSENMDSRRA